MDGQKILSLGRSFEGKMIDVSIETHRGLYSDVNKCVQFCKDTPDIFPTKDIQFHVYWKEGIKFGRKQALIAKSYLATQDIHNSSFTYWSNIDLTKNEYFRPLMPHIVFRKYDVMNEARGTILENRKGVLMASDRLNYLEGDLFRILILYKYGGFYLDVDNVLYRDFSIFWDQEFMYTWSHMVDRINGAVMHLKKESKLAGQLLDEILSTPPRKNSTCWSCDSYMRVREKNKEWSVLPCAFFNPEWQYHLTNEQKKGKTKEDTDLMDLILRPFNKHNMSNEFFDGTFSWHWHNQWLENIELGSKWDLVEKRVESQIESRKCNGYFD